MPRVLAVVALVVWGACGNDDVVEADVELAHFFGLATNHVIKDAADEFFRETGIRVDVRRYPRGLLQRQLFNERISADLLHIDVAWLGMLHRVGRVTNLDSYYRAWGERRGIKGGIELQFNRHLESLYRHPATSTARPHEGDFDAYSSLYGLPLSSGAHILAYNKALFRQHLHTERAPDTFEEAIRWGQRISAAEGKEGRFITPFALPGHGETVLPSLLPMLLGNGTTFFGEEGAQCTFESKGFRDGFNFYLSIFDSMLPEHKGLEISDLIAAFLNGEIVMLIGPSSLLLRECCRGLEVGYAPVPAGNQARLTHFDGSGLVIPLSVPAARKKKAWAFAEYFIESPNNYLLELVKAELGALPAYEFVFSALAEDADGVQMSEFRLYEVSLRTVRLTADMFSVPSGRKYKPWNLATNWNGDWVDLSEQPEFTINFGRPQKLVAYELVTAATAIDRDPTSWYIYYTTDDSDNWKNLVVVTNAGYDLMPLARNTPTPILFFKEAVVVTKLKFVVRSVRKVVCGEGCQTTISQLSSTVELSYPNDWNKCYANAIVSNDTVTRMLERVLLEGESIESATARGCTEVLAIVATTEKALAMREETQEQNNDTKDALLYGGIILFFVLVLVAAAVLIHKKYYMREVEDRFFKLKSDREMAEDLANAVAGMNLEAVQYLKGLESPSRIQQSFIQIAKTLAEYRMYLPAAILWSKEEEDDSGGAQSSAREEQPEERSEASEFDTIGLRERPEGGEPPRVGNPLAVSYGGRSRTSLPTQAKIMREAFEQGVQMKKATLLIVSNGRIDEHANQSLDDLTDWLQPVLSSAQNHKGILLTLRPDAVLVSWNAHRPCAKPVLLAMQCAHDVGNRLRQVLGDHSQLHTMALSSGRVHVGHFGWAQQRVPFVMGVALAQVEAMSSLTQKLNAFIIATDSVIEYGGPTWNVRPVDVLSHDPKTNTAPFITIWEVRGVRDDVLGPQMGFHATIDAKGEMYDCAWHHFVGGRYTDAHAAMTEYARAEPRDAQALRILKIAGMADADREALLDSGAWADEDEGGPERVYYRRFEGWKDLEAVCADVSLPEGVPKLQSPVPTNLKVDDLMDIKPEVQSEDFKHDVEREQERERHRRQAVLCPKCRTKMKVGSQRKETELKCHCFDCRARVTGRCWICRGCGSVFCFHCVPYRTADSQQVRATVSGRCGGEYRRSGTILGKGAFGTVWLGLDVAGGLCAIKTVKIKAEATREIASLVSEVQMFSNLRHENIVSYLSSCVVDGCVVIVMEYVSGGSLGQLLDQFGRLTLEAIKRYMPDILRGLAFLHSNEIVHRDLKPANVLLMPDGQCKLTDFGTSTSTKDVAEGGDQRVLGTPVFLSPEAAVGECCNEVDIWALGISLHMFYTGSVPYDIANLNMKELLRQRINGEPVPNIDLVKGPVGDIIRLCVVNDPKQRPSAAELLQHPLFQTQNRPGTKNSARGGAMTTS